MASIKDDREESDGDEVEQESPDSDKSSSSTDSSDGSDSDSSELDSEECERRRNVLIDHLSDMERQFLVLREQLYKERITDLKTKMEELSEGIAEEYIQPLDELKYNNQTRIEVAGILKKLRLESIEKVYKAEEIAAKQNLENEKKLLFDLLQEELNEKIRRLEEEHHSSDFHSNYFSAEKKRGANSLGLKARGGSWRKGHKSESGRKKPVTVTGPVIVYMLSDQDIMDDLTVIKKALAKSNLENKSYHHPYR